jgi:RNA polymerase primary sigma factor
MTESSDAAVMRQYIADIAQYPAMTDGDQRQLHRAIEQGAAARDELMDLGPGSPQSVREDLRAQAAAGETAQRRLTRSNLQFVVEIAKTYEPTGRPLVELVQSGNLGLLRAIEAFDRRQRRSFRDHIEATVRDAIASSDQ